MEFSTELAEVYRELLLTGIETIDEKIAEIPESERVNAMTEAQSDIMTRYVMFLIATDLNDEFKKFNVELNRQLGVA